MVEQDDEATEDDVDLPSHGDLLLNRGLYEQFDLVGDWTYVKRFFYGPELQFDAYCVHCGKDSTFRQDLGPRGSGSGTRPPEDSVYLEPRLINLTFRCQRESGHEYYYVLRVHRQAIEKIGQSPSLATVAISEASRFEKVLEQTYLGDLKRAIGLFAHGIGAGSFVYLRRIFEHLLQATADRARAAGDELFDFDRARVDEKIRALAAHLPSELVEVAGVYSVLSAGIHELSEQRCLSLFPVMFASIELILDGHIATRRKDESRRELKNALARAEIEISTRTSKR